MRLHSPICRSYWMRNLTMLNLSLWHTMQCVTSSSGTHWLLGGGSGGITYFGDSMAGELNTWGEMLYPLEVAVINFLPGVKVPGECPEPGGEMCADPGLAVYKEDFYLNLPPQKCKHCYDVTCLPVKLVTCKWFWVPFWRQTKMKTSFNCKLLIQYWITYWLLSDFQDYFSKREKKPDNYLLDKEISII